MHHYFVQSLWSFYKLVGLFSTKKQSKKFLGVAMKQRLYCLFQMYLKLMIWPMPTVVVGKRFHEWPEPMRHQHLF